MSLAGDLSEELNARRAIPIREWAKIESAKIESIHNVASGRQYGHIGQTAQRQAVDASKPLPNNRFPNEPTS
jgi:hypothetical protein